MNEASEIGLIGGVSFPELDGVPDDGISGDHTRAPVGPDVSLENAAFVPRQFLIGVALVDRHVEHPVTNFLNIARGQANPVGKGDLQRDFGFLEI